MPKIKFNYVVSCSSEDSIHIANNLLNNDSNKKWKSKNTGESSVSLILQLEKHCKISGIDIGNESSSFVEVFVGNSTSPNQDYQMILAMSSFMTPMESRNMTNCNRVRMFTYEQLVSPARDEKWDRIKVVCTQPFNNHVQYGLSFITLHTPQNQETKSEESTIGKFVVRPESPDLPAGSLFAKRKEKVDENITVAQTIKNANKLTNTPVNIKVNTNKKIIKNDTEVKDRNRKDLFYDSEDSEANEKIDKVMNQVKEEEEKRKAENKILNNSLKKNKNNCKENSPSSSGSSGIAKRKLDINVNNIQKKKVKLVTMRFNKLLSGVVFTISGIVNPERANIRSLALKMGAKYVPDWNNSCTHLICAFANTPKFQQVRGKGKIVTKFWIQDCYDQRKRLPWRRYALDRNDQQKPESEDEICETEEEIEEDNKNESKTEIHDVSGSDTEDEIEKILNKNKETVKENDPFEVDTEEEQEVQVNSADLKEEIPRLFKTEIFYIDNVFDEDEMKQLKRLIVAFGGVVLSSLRDTVDFVITNEDSVENIKDKNETVKCVSSSWILEIHDIMKYIPYDKFLLQ